MDRKFYKIEYNTVLSETTILDPRFKKLAFSDNRAVDEAKAAAALWELRLRVAEENLAQYRETCGKLARANDELANQLYQQEKDAIDITGHLKERDEAKEEKEARAREEQNKLVEDYTCQINALHELFRKKSSDFRTIQDGMKKIQEFQKTKAQMEQELSDKEHRENLNKMEYRFFTEKARLEREAEQQIALVVEKAHSEAIVQLDDASRSVFKENVRLNEALKYHMKETENLQKLTASLGKENASLALDKNMLELMVKESAVQIEAQKQKLSKLRAKVASLEQALKLKAGELEREKCKEEAAAVGIPASQVELESLQKALAMRDRELGHIRGLARTIVEQRTELEQFFHEALAQVKQEIAASRLRCTKEALQAYRWKLREATAGKIKFPPICTFHKSPHSTNSVHSHMAAAEKWTHQPGSKVEMSELTWEQKEHVLRLLFAKMNGQRKQNLIKTRVFLLSVTTGCFFCLFFLISYLFSVEVHVPSEGSSRSGEGEHGQWNRDRNIDTDLQKTIFPPFNFHKWHLWENNSPGP
uniref:Basal body-orientation factor 1 n=1 Tax=Mola mola TaxID=94237 RepID=A0A3Q3VLD9_MOLML